MTIFDGYEFANRREAELKARLVQITEQGIARPQVAAILFSEDKGSQLYTQFKHDAAERIGIGYQVHQFSIKDHQSEDPNSPVLAKLQELNQDSNITGIIIQKPWRSVWAQTMVVERDVKSSFDAWWQSLTDQINQDKDVDGLHPETLQSIQSGTWHEQGKVLPATCRAVLQILDKGANLDYEEFRTAGKKVLILGKSDILGLPLYYVLKNQGANVESLDSQDFKARQDSGQLLSDADVVVSATGRHLLIKGNMLKPGCVVIDVGEPRPDLDRESLPTDPALQPSFITPVPGGVGPMTVVSLMENALDLV